MSDRQLRALSVRVFTSVDPRTEVRSIKWLAAAMTGAPKFTRDPVVVVVTNEKGEVMNYSAFGDVPPELRLLVENEFPTIFNTESID